MNSATRIGLKCSLALALVALLGVPASGTTGPLVGHGEPGEDFRATKVPLVWVVGSPTEPRASLIRKLPQGAVVSILSDRGSWLRVAIVDGSGQGGFVLASLLNAAPPASVKAALFSEKHADATTTLRVGSVYGTDDEASGFRQASVPKVWVVGDPERIFRTLILKLDEGDCVRVLSSGEIWSKVELPDGSGGSGYVMNRWTMPASYDAIRRWKTGNRPGIKEVKAPVAVKAPPKPEKPPYLVKKDTEPPKATEPAKVVEEAPPKQAEATTPKPVVIKLAGIGTPSPEASTDEATVEDPNGEEDADEAMFASVPLLIVFVLSAIGLFVFFMVRRSREVLGDGAMDCLGKIKIDSGIVLTLVRVPGKLLVMLKTPEGVDILREIETDESVAPAQAMKILENSYVGPLPTASSALSPAEALASRSSGAVYHNGRRAGADPLQARLGAARSRMRQVIG